jgi:hypothetical protein
MSYVNCPAELVAEDLLIAALGLPRHYEEPEAVCSTSASVGELLEAGVTFAMVADAAEERSERRLRVVEGRGAYHDSTAVDSPWWTTTGDDPVIHDQYTQADFTQSAGGWSLIHPEEPDTEAGDTQPAETWSAFRLHIKRAAEERKERVCRIFDWLRRQPSAKAINSQWWRFRERNRQGYRAYLASGRDTTKLWLTKAQKDSLERYYRIRLRQLP